jgi:hypothetical protein
VISQSGESLLLLDNFPAGAADNNLGHADSDIEDLVKVILEYCPSLTILIRSRRNPASYAIPLVQLRALDEADLRIYILEHRRGGPELASSASIGVLMRHTDGIPTRIDRTLKDLEVIPLSELMSMDSDVMTISAEEATSPSLSKVIKELAASGDLRYQRSFFLLKVLSLFPQGEQLTRIKRFYQNMPFFPAHATELLDQALIEVTTVQRLEKEVGSLAKTLVVPRPVRECVRSLMESEEISRMNHRAAEIYFGQQWVVGTFKFPPAYKFDEPHCANADLANASAIILRLLREAISMADLQYISRVLSLAEFYLKALREGNHYNNIALFCDELVPLVPVPGFEEKRSLFQSLHAYGLRMLGEHDRAKAILLDIDIHSFSRPDQQSALINLAFCHESVGEPDDARRVAEEVIGLDRHSNRGLQARALLIELDEHDPKRTEKLVRMESLCRKQRADVVANNIAIILAREAGDNPDHVRRILSPVMRSAKDNTDYYNRTRAALKLAALALNAGEKLSESELLYLIGAYHFLFNERLPGLFDQCHDSLWRTFEGSRDTENLLTLFRHSSLYWRLQGEERKEGPYLKKLSKVVGD